MLDITLTAQREYVKPNNTKRMTAKDMKSLADSYSNAEVLKDGRRLVELGIERGWIRLPAGCNRHWSDLNH